MVALQCLGLLHREAIKKHLLYLTCVLPICSLSSLPVCRRISTTTTKPPCQISCAQQATAKRWC